ncbi:MAG: hypothetical protein ACQR33_04855 [Candidatus Saccharibacteria bacterium]
MSKIDYKKELEQFYAAKVDNPVIVRVPKMNFIMIDGKGDPMTDQEYIDAVQTLYPVAYMIKFGCRLNTVKILASCRSKDYGGPKT